MTKNFLNLATGINLRVKKQTQNRINPNKSTLGHIRVKLLKN